jgi:hypothetical protein
MGRVSQVGKVVKARIARVRESMGLSFSELGIDRSPQLIQEGSRNYLHSWALSRQAQRMPLGAGIS